MSLLKNKIKEKVNILEKENSSLNILFESEDTKINVKLAKYILVLEWFPRFSNSLDGAIMEIVIKQQIFRRDFRGPEYIDLNLEKYIFNINIDRKIGWTCISGKKFYSSDTIIDKWLRLLFEKIKGDVDNMTTY